MDIVNERIQHSVFGEGMVISNGNGRLSIQFSEPYGIKQFLYPDAFEKYLKLYNSDLELSVLEDLHKKQAQIEADRLRKQQEQEEADRIMALERLKHTTVKKKPAPKRKTSKQKKESDLNVSEISEDNED